MRLFLWGRRRSSRERPLVENEAYARCYGDRTDEIRIVRVERPAPPPPLRSYVARLTDAQLRRAFADRLDRRGAGDENLT
jgi:hypothetical protein